MAEKRVALRLSVLVLLSSAAAAGAQEVPTALEPGDRVRVTCLAPERRVVGTLKSATGEELVVESSGKTVTVRRDAVVGLEKSLGRRSRWSTRIGGAAFTGLFVAGSLSGCPAICVEDGAGGCKDICGYSAEDYAVVAASAAVGFGLGSLFKTEKWQKTSGPVLALQAAPIRGGARVGLRLTF